jgi:hypothetical protein
MKMVHSLKNAASRSSQEELSVKDSKKRKPKVTATAKKSINTTTNNVPLGNLEDNKEKRSKKMKTTSEQVAQGGRKVPEARDKHGCVHHGLMDLLALPKGYLKTYMKVGG